MVFEVFVAYILHNTALRIATGVAETCTCWIFTTFIICFS